MSSLRLAAAGAAIFAGVTLCLAASIAEAAKGVKKVRAVGDQHTLTGEVVNVTHKNGVGSFHLRMARNHKKLARGGAGGNGNHRGEEFHVTSATRFMGGGGGNVGLASLRRGERVQVRANGHQAEKVQILGRQNSTGNQRHHYVNGSYYRHHRAGFVQRHPTTHAAHHHHRHKK
jgi:hypothetical protein